MKYIEKFNENDTVWKSSKNMLESFYYDYKKLCQEDHLSNYDIFTEIGQLILNYNLTKYDILEVLNTFNCKFDINGFLQQTYDDWDKITDVDNIWDELLHRISGYSFPKDYYTVLDILKSKYSITRK